MNTPAPTPQKILVRINTLQKRDSSDLVVLGLGEPSIKLQFSGLSQDQSALLLNQLWHYCCGGTNDDAPVGCTYKTYVSTKDGAQVANALRALSSQGASFSVVGDTTQHALDAETLAAQIQAKMLQAEKDWNKNARKTGHVENYQKPEGFTHRS